MGTDKHPEGETLTDGQWEAIQHLPADKHELGDALGIKPDSAHRRLKNARRRGADVVCDEDDGYVYRLASPVPADQRPRSARTDGADAEPASSAEKRGGTTDTTDAPRPAADDADAVVRALQGGGLTYDAFEADFGLSQSQARDLMQDLREAGYSIEHKEVDEYGTRLFHVPDEHDKHYLAGDGDGIYQFALISDTHLGSKAEHLDELHDFYDRLADLGIETVFHAGDLSDGWKIHKGQLNEIRGEAAGWDRLLTYCTEHYPQREGIHTFFIEGNHDHKYHRRNGIHWGALLDDRRDDLHYMGDSMARFVFDPAHDIDLELIHPSGGKPYTPGYRAMTLYRERPLESRPALAGIGHLHGSLFMQTEGVYMFYAGAWKGLTTWGKRKGHQSSIGGWVVELEIEAGEVRTVVPTWVGYDARDETTNYSAEDLEALVGGQS